MADARKCSTPAERVVFCNAAAEQITDYRADEVLGDAVITTCAMRRSTASNFFIRRGGLHEPYLSRLLIYISEVGRTTTVMAQGYSTRPQPAGVLGSVRPVPGQNAF
jgi:hypothetical protein